MRLRTKQGARRLIRRLDQEYSLLHRGERRSLEARWTEYLGLVGQSVRAECAGGLVQEGRLRGLGFDGVTLAPPGADPLVLSPERVLHLTPC